MKKILVLGCCGSGKSTFSLKLSTILNIPVIHLDQHYFGPNWEEPGPNSWRATVSSLCAPSQWIMDGNYGGSLDIRLKHADTVIYLDNSTISSLYRVIKRTFKYHGKVRPDLAPDCKERFDLPFLFYVLHFNRVKRPSILSRTRKNLGASDFFILKNAKDRHELLSSLTKNKRS